MSVIMQQTLKLTIDWTSTWKFRPNRVLRRIFGPKRREGTGSWRRLHNE